MLGMCEALGSIPCTPPSLSQLLFLLMITDTLLRLYFIFFKTLSNLLILKPAHFNPDLQSIDLKSMMFTMHSLKNKQTGF